VKIKSQAKNKNNNKRVSTPSLSLGMTISKNENDNLLFFFQKIQKEAHLQSRPSHTNSIIITSIINNMAFGLAAAMVSELTSRPFIQAALASPRSPQSVLSSSW